MTHSDDSRTHRFLTSNRVGATFTPWPVTAVGLVLAVFLGIELWLTNHRYRSLP